jgi:hypothetical protein
MNEVGTSTASVASFARPVFSGAIRRTWAVEDPFFKKKKKKKKRKKK